MLGLWRFQVAGCAAKKAGQLEVGTPTVMTAERLSVAGTDRVCSKAVGREQAGAYLVSPCERPSGGLLEAVFAHNGRRVSAGGFLIAV